MTGSRSNNGYGPSWTNPLNIMDARLMKISASSTSSIQSQVDIWFVGPHHAPPPANPAGCEALFAIGDSERLSGEDDESLQYSQVVSEATARREVSDYSSARWMTAGEQLGEPVESRSKISCADGDLA